MKMWKSVIFVKKNLKINMWKIKNIIISIEKGVRRIGKNGEKVIINISYILKFLDSPRIMASSLSNLVNNLSEGTHKIKCKYGHNDKKYETCGITCEVCGCFLKYTNIKDELIEYKCLCCDKIHQQKFDEKLKERFFNT